MNKCIGENRLTYLWGKIKAFVSASYAPLASPALTGTPTAPTAASGTNTTQVATTAFVQGEISSALGDVETLLASI